MAISLQIDSGKKLTLGASAAPHRKRSVRTTVRWLGLAAVAVLAAMFFFSTAAKYFNWDQKSYGLYWPYRVWILPHVIGGSMALLLGPMQFCTGLRQKHLTFHRWTGRLYLFGVALGAVGAFYMAFHSVIGWMFGIALFALGVVWVISSAMAYVSIRRRQIAAHKEWMIRSYILTFTFVSFRLLAHTPLLRHTGTRHERLATLVWLSWTIPLFICEAIFQWRRLKAHPPVS